MNPIEVYSEFLRETLQNSRFEQHVKSVCAACRNELANWNVDYLPWQGRGRHIGRISSGRCKVSLSRAPRKRGKLLDDQPYMIYDSYLRSSVQELYVDLEWR
jgi:ABC-type taurine transport system ATPase subunit